MKKGKWTKMLLDIHIASKYDKPVDGNEFKTINIRAVGRSGNPGVPTFRECVSTGQRFTTKGWPETAIMLCKLNKSM